MTSPDDHDDAGDLEPSDYELGRIVLRLIGGVVALLLAGGVASAASMLGAEETDPVEAPALSLAGAGAIGPLPGTPLATYVAQRVNALGETRGRKAAVVSFDSYVTADVARRMVAPLEVRTLLAAIPGGRPVVADADADLAGLAAKQREEAILEKEALEQLLPSVEDPDFARQYRADIDRLNEMLAKRPDSTAFVFAVVVVDKADALRSLSARAGVRLVDVGEGAALPAQGAAVGLRPEEAVRAGEPPNRPIRACAASQCRGATGTLPRALATMSASVKLSRWLRM